MVNTKTGLKSIAKKGYRVLVFAKYMGIPDQKPLTEDVEVLGFTALSNPIRKGAVDTFRYFDECGVEIKVISGDNPVTVSAIAKRGRNSKSG